MSSVINPLIVAFILAVSVSGCWLNPDNDLPFGTHELSMVDFTQRTTFRPETYTGDGKLLPGECETYANPVIAPDHSTEFCFPEGSYLALNQDRTYELSTVDYSLEGFTPRRSSGTFYRSGDYLLLQPPGNSDRFRVNYTDDEVIGWSSFGDAYFTYKRQ